MPVTLRPYQEYFEEEVFSLIGQGMKNICIAAYTGTGKTYMSASIAEKFLAKGGVVIFIAPRINLVYQTIKSFEHLGRVQVIQGQNKYDEDGYIYIASLATLIRRNFSFTPTLIIHDEKHHGFNGKATKMVTKKFPEAVYLSLTATPFDAKGYPLKGFDEIIKYKTVQWYIDNGYLTDCECYAPVMPDLSKVSIVGGDYNEKEIDAIMNNKVMIGNILEETVNRIKGKKTLFFAVTIAHAKEVALQYRIAGYRAIAYHSNLDDAVREQIIKDFEDNKIDILVSVTALVMGFDVPSVDCIIVARPTKSQSFYRQLIGRGMRPFPGKKFCLLIDCAGVIKENGMPNEEVIPKVKTQKMQKIMICEKCHQKSFPISKSLRKIDGILNYVTTWSCRNSHTFETLKEAGVTMCPVCSAVIAQGRAKFEESEKEYIVYTECTCGERIIIRTIPKVKGKLAKIEASRVTILDLLNKIKNLAKDSQKDMIDRFCKYVNEIIHPDMRQQCLSSLYVSLDMQLPDQEIETALMQTVVDASLRTNHFKCLSPRLIKMAYEQTSDPANIIHIHNSRAVNSMNPAWLNKTIQRLREFEEEFPHTKSWLLKAIKTRCQNIHQKQQKMASLYYFFDMLADKEKGLKEGADGF